MTTTVLRNKVSGALGDALLALSPQDIAGQAFPGPNLPFLSPQYADGKFLDIVGPIVRAAWSACRDVVQIKSQRVKSFGGVGCAECVIPIVASSRAPRSQRVTEAVARHGERTAFFRPLRD